MAADEAQLRQALQWETGQRPPDDKSTWEWLWEAIQGDFNDNRSNGQIAFDAAVSMIPLVDQICDVRDLIANCKSIASSDEEDDNTWKWVAISLTLIGLIPTLGSALKGVLKIMFTFVRRHGMNMIDKAVDLGMTWVITFLRKAEVQAYLRQRKVDEVFKWLANQVRAFQGRVNTAALLSAFDNGIALLKGLLERVTWIPKIGSRAKQAIEMVERVRAAAPKPLAAVDALLQRVLGSIASRFDMEHLLTRHGILNANNVHFRGALPETRAVTLMRSADPRPSWLSKGRKVDFPEQRLGGGQQLVTRTRAADPDFPTLSDGNIQSFHRMAAVEIKGPARLYRVVSPSNGAMGDCWIPEDVWNRIMASPDPKTAWRKHLAVWPNWNPDSQFVVMEIPAGQSIKAWRGPASSQVRKDLPDAHLEGGWDQVIFKPKAGEWDTTRIYQLGRSKGAALRKTDMSHDQYSKLPKDEQALYVPIRERINHPHIRGPLDTGWAPTDFDAQLNDMRIGVPSLPGQITN